MKNEIKISVRAFPVIIEDARTGEKRSDMLVLSKELIYRMYNRQGYKVLEIGKPDKHGLALDLTTRYQLEKMEVNA